METIKQYILDKTPIDKWKPLVTENKDLLSHLFELSIANEEMYSWRAAWILDHLLKTFDYDISKEFDRITEALEGKTDGHQRQLLRFLLRIKLSKKQEGIVFDLCLTIWEDVNKIPSTRITAFKILSKIAKNYPELKNEISFFTTDYYTQTLSPGIKNSLSKLI